MNFLKTFFVLVCLINVTEVQASQKKSVSENPYVEKGIFNKRITQAKVNEVVAEVASNLYPLINTQGRIRYIAPDTLLDGREKNYQAPQGFWVSSYNIVNEKGAMFSLRKERGVPMSQCLNAIFYGDDVLETECLALSILIQLKAAEKIMGTASFDTFWKIFEDIFRIQDSQLSSIYIATPEDFTDGPVASFCRNYFIQESMRECVGQVFYIPNAMPLYKQRHPGGGSPGENVVLVKKEGGISYFQYFHPHHLSPDPSSRQEILNHLYQSYQNEQTDLEKLRCAFISLSEEDQVQNHDDPLPYEAWLIEQQKSQEEVPTKLELNVNFFTKILKYANKGISLKISEARKLILGCSNVQKIIVQ